MRSTSHAPNAKETDANREFKHTSRTSWEWFFLALIAFMSIDYFTLR
jgi:hypothetical protein